MTDYEDQSLQNFFMGFNRQIIPGLNFGTKVGLERFHFTGQFFRKEIKSDAIYNYMFSLGLNYEMDNRVRMAMVYRYFNPLTYKFTMNTPIVIAGTDSIGYILEETKSHFRLPWFLDFGIHLKPTAFLNLMFKIEYQEWQKISKSHENRLQLSFGATVTPFDRWQWSLGAFTCGQFPDRNDGLEDTPFLTLGMRYRILPGLTASMSVLSNTFFVRKVNDSVTQIGRSQILFGAQWQLGE